MTSLRFDESGVLFFPVTPFGAAGDVDAGLLREHVQQRLDDDPAGVFAACGTGEYHALAADEYRNAITAAVDAVAGADGHRRVPVVGGTGGPIGHAVRCARHAADAGADGLLVLPPYLVGSPQDGLVAYVEAVAAATDLPLVVYHRANAQFTPASIARLLADPRVVGVKDGVGDLAVLQQFMLAAANAGQDETVFFNGLLTAELTQAAYGAIGVPFYSSAVFAMAPDIATAFLQALRGGDDERCRLLLDEFYVPLVQLRDETPGFAVALIKAGVRLDGLAVGGVRPPLVDPSPDQEARLSTILARGRTALS